MNKYEFVYIIDAHASQSIKDEVAKQVADTAAKADVKIVNSQVWLDKHKMSFPINKVIEGAYYMLNIQANSAAINKMQSLLRINEQILRFMAVRLES